MAIQKTVDVNTFLDERPMGRRQWLVVTLGVLILILDGFDTTMIGFIAPALIEDWGVARHDLGPLMMSGLIGLAIGSLISGPLADRFGRKFVIITSVVFFGLWCLASAFANDLTTLTVLRFLTGLGLGASMPNTSTLVSEFAPKKRRSHLVTSAYCGFAAGGALGGLASEHLIELFGWRSVFVVGGVLPLILAVALIFCLPESIRFMIIAGKAKEKIVAAVNALVPGLSDAKSEFINSEYGAQKLGDSNAKIGIRGLFDIKYRLGTFMVWISMFMGLLTMYLLGNWLPIIVSAEGYTLSQAAIIGAMLQLGGVFGNFTMGMKMDRWEKNTVVSLTMAGGAIMSLMIALMGHTAISIGILIFIMGYFSNAVNTGCFALATAFYPTQMRATGVSWVSGIGRLGAIFGAGFGAVIIGQHWSMSQIFVFLCIPPLIGVIATQVKRRSENKRAKSAVVN
ncbi:MFS transporter [Pseudomonas fluorescens]|uniref:4-hydroxybenzoate transporter PcaK n=1 Tax=Pseudomonas fluorescens TaxID=294 RepID=A0A5E7GPU4_PSEFL|nr:aromatic acid/H+ symport family MFS transporter [Pseudomonas fluorescens]VVO53550.1 4-hydroxybenzoate transporter PcaK [Pseudomonas fluorescens]